MVDEDNGIAQVVEKCISRGPGEWDVVNRRRTGGVIRDIRMEGYTLIMDTVNRRELDSVQYLPRSEVRGFRL